MRKIQGGCQPLSPSAAERGLKIQSSTFLRALMNPRTFTLDLQRAICSADDLLEGFGTAISTQCSAEQASGLGEGMPTEDTETTAIFPALMAA